MELYSGIVEVNGRTVNWATTFPRSFRFRCTGCGYCCASSNVEMSADELLGIEGLGKSGFSEEFNEDGRRGIRIAGSDIGPCTFLDAKRACTIYAKRPLPCRLYPFRIIALSPTQAYVDILQSCPAVLQGEMSESEDVDFGGMVRDYFSHPFTRVSERPASVRERWDGELALRACWSHLAGRVGENLEEWWDVLAAFETAARAFGRLRRSDVDTLIASVRVSPSEISPTYDGSAFRGTHTRPYQGIHFQTNELYYFRLENEHVSFGETRIPYTAILKKKLTPAAQEAVRSYLHIIWDRKQLTRIIDDMLLHDAKLTALCAQLQLMKRRILLFAFFMDAISHWRGHDALSVDDVREAIVPFDLIFCSPPRQRA